MLPLPRIPPFSRSLLWSTALHGGALAALVAAGVATLSRPRGVPTDQVAQLVMAPRPEHRLPAAERVEPPLEALPEAPLELAEPWLPRDDPRDETLEDPAAGDRSVHPVRAVPLPRRDLGPDPLAGLDPRLPVAVPPETRSLPPEVAPETEDEPTALDAPAPASTASPSGAETDDPAPTLLEGSDPEYPLLARRKGWEGEVLLGLVISPTGRVTATRVLESSGHAVLDNAAQEAALSWTFAPALASGRPVEVEIQKRFRFDLGADDREP